MSASQSQVGVSSSSAQDVAPREAELWAQFADARAERPEQFSASWLRLQCRMLPDTRRGMVLLGDPDGGPYRVVAVWPAELDDTAELMGVAERALAERRGLLEPSADDQDKAVQIAYPIEADDALHGVVVLELAPVSKSRLQSAFRQLHWGMAWMEILIRRRTAATGRGDESARLELMVELVATVVEEARFQGAAMAFATELAVALRCDRASLGFTRGNAVKVAAISHTVEFGKHMNLVRAIENAMEEALDQQTAVTSPQPAEDVALVTRAQEALREAHGAVAVCSIPFAIDGELVGVVTLERNRGEPFDESDARLAEGVAGLVGPVLTLKRQEDRWLAAKALHAARGQLVRLFGPRHLGYKLAASLVLAMTAFLSLAVGEYRVSADAVLEGAVQRIVVAPQEGFIAAAEVRAGDLVASGQVMARLDSRDLELERLKLSSQREQLEKEYRDALAGSERAQVRIFAAQIRQVDAQLALLDEQLDRLVLHAPFDGLVVAGDLSQSLGAPVERGEQMYVVAPLEAYRVVVQVDERQIADVEPGQTGRLALAGDPSNRFELVVRKLTPVASAEQGRNFFRVEAELMESPPSLRPGMKGVAKIDVGERGLAWIWTRELVNWFHLTLWSYWP